MINDTENKVDNSRIKLVKKIITEVTFRECTSEPDDLRVIKLAYESEGAGRYLVLSDGGYSGFEVHLHHPDDFRLLWETAKELWEQGSIYAESEDW